MKEPKGSPGLQPPSSDLPTGAPNKMDQWGTG